MRRKFVIMLRLHVVINERKRGGVPIFCVVRVKAQQSWSNTTRSYDPWPCTNPGCLYSYVGVASPHAKDD